MSQDTGSQKPEAQQEAPQITGKPASQGSKPPQSLKPQGKAKASKSQGKSQKPAGKPASQGKEAQQEASKPQIQIIDNEAELLDILNQAMGSQEAPAGQQEAQQEAPASQPEASQGKAEAKAKAEAQKMAKAQQGTKAKLNQITVIFQNLTHLADNGASIAKARLTPEAQQACKVANLASLKAQGKKALESAQEASQEVYSAISSPEAREAQKKAQEAYKVISGAYKEAQKIDRAIARSIARADKQAQQEAQKKAREELKAGKVAQQKAQQMARARELQQLLDSAVAELQGESSQPATKMIVVNLSDAHVKVLNQIADGIWFRVDNGEMTIIPAVVDLPSKRMKAIMEQVIEMGLVSKSDEGYMLTGDGLALFQTDLEEVKSNFAAMLNPPQVKAS